MLLKKSQKTMLREIIALLSACLLTVILEFITLYILKVRDSRLYFSIPINIGTNVLLNVLLSLSQKPLYYLFLIIGEIIVIIVEALFYQLIKKENKNYLYSLIANLISGVFGSLLINLLLFVCFN